MDSVLGHYDDSVCLITSLHWPQKYDWSDFNAKRKSLGYDRNVIIDEACKAIRGCGQAWKVKSLGYMLRMAWTSQEGDPENNMSDKEWSLILRAQSELGLSDDERKNSYQDLPRK